MSKKKLFIGANFKMNECPMELEMACSEGKTTAYHATKDVDAVVFPTFVELHGCMYGKLTVGAQYGHPDDSGAFTGDVSMAMLAGMQVQYVLCGHSERRHHHEESDAMVAKQVASAIRNGLVPVLCIGENADQRELDQTEEVLLRQLKAVTDVCGKKLTAKNFIVAYEPIWAIGSGKTPDAADADKAHALIRGALPDSATRIIYGGSVNAKNAAAFFAQKNIDGALVGGCSLKPDDFAGIVEAAKK